MSKFKLFVILVVISALRTTDTFAQLKPAEIDALVERALKTFDVPGIAVAVVKDDKIVYAHGYGVRSLATKKPVDENTLFGIASNSKAFTAAALGILSDEGKLKLDDKVTDHIPEFKLYDPYVTAEFTIRDLLTHRSGLGLGAGDLMDFPDSTDFTLTDVIHNLRYFKPVSSFRTKYDYDNQLYKVAGEVVARASGMSWEDFVETRIMRPLGMQNSSASYQRLKDLSNVIDAHVKIDGKVEVVQRYTSVTGNAAGGIYSSVNDLAKWAIMQMNNGKYGANQRLFSEAIHKEMWDPQTIIPVSAPGIYNTHFAAYGLGWRMSDIKGYKEVNHTGGVDGMRTKVNLIPELKLGIIVLTNQQADGAYNAIVNQIKDSYLGLPYIDWIKRLDDAAKQAGEGSNATVTAVWKQADESKKAGMKIDPAFLGTYHDNWLGDVTLSNDNGTIWFKAKRSPKLSGQLLPYKANTCIVRWTIRDMDADAFLIFTMDENNKPSGFKMKPISPATDFSYDFQDLDLRR